MDNKLAFTKNNLVILLFICVIFVLLFNISILTHETAAQITTQYDNAFLRIMIKYPSDWTALSTYKGVLFISPSISASILNSARVFVEPPIDISNMTPDQIQYQLENYYASKEDFKPTLVNKASNFVYVFYNYTDPVFRKTVAGDIFILNNELSTIHYSAPPSVFFTYFPVFLEMLKSYHPIAPTITPTQPQSDCFNTDLDVSAMVASCAIEDHQSMSPLEANTISKAMEKDWATNFLISSNGQ